MRKLLVAVVMIAVLAPATAMAAVNDPYYALQWGLKGVGAPAAWGVGTGSGRIVAVIDTGVDPTHPDLRGQLVPGHDFVDGDAQPWDENGHGTLVAGIIAAITGNGVGVASVAPHAKIMPIRVLGADGTGSSSNVAAGIQWATSHGAAVVNLSLAQESGADNSLQLLRAPAVDQAIKAAAAAGAVVVVAAGNTPTGGVGVTSYDATKPGVIVVGSSTASDRRAAYSNYGSGLDLLAPGGGSATDPSSAACTQDSSIVSTWWNPDTRRSSYGGGCGTSMAVAFVSGVAAMLSAHGYNNAAAVDRMMQTADDIGAKGRDDGSGYGILNAARALGARATAPVTTTSSSPAPRPRSSRVTAAGTTGRVPSSSAVPRAGNPVVNELPSARAFGPTDIGASQRSGPVAAAAGLICLLIVGHAIRAVRRQPAR
ncbi:MAG: S8 family serine peptidase [Actinomycetota bacterium]